MSPLFIVQGVWYSLEQCGLLLSDASDRFVRARHGTAIALALLAREELGKSRLLIEVFRKAVQGHATTLDEVRAQLRNHPAKQAAALLSIGLIAERGTPLADLMHRAFNDMGAPASEAAMREFGEILDQRAEALPRERRTLRERGLYVDPSEDGSAWERPRDFNGALAEEELYSALNDYSGLRAGLATADGYADVRAALEEWPQRPELLPPPWPK